MIRQTSLLLVTTQLLLGIARASKYPRPICPEAHVGSSLLFKHGLCC